MPYYHQTYGLILVHAKFGSKDSGSFTIYRAPQTLSPKCGQFSD